MSATGDVKVKGLRELAIGNSILSKRIERDASSRFLKVAEHVALQVAARVPHRTGRLAGDVEASESLVGSGAVVGYRSLPYAGPVDFGGYPPGRPYVPTGRYLYPAARGADGELETAGELAAETQIASNPWPIPVL